MIRADATVFSKANLILREFSYYTPVEVYFVNDTHIFSDPSSYVDLGLQNFYYKIG